MADKLESTGSVRGELELFARQADAFRRMLDPDPSDVLGALAAFLRRFEMSTAYPLLLHLSEVGLSDDQWREVGRILESYVVRRTVCGLTTKNYNRVFLPLIKEMQGIIKEMQG